MSQFYLLLECVIDWWFHLGSDKRDASEKHFQ